MNHKEEKQNLLDKLSEVISAYDEYSKSISPKHWRTTGRHFIDLNMIKREVEDLSEISEVDIKNITRYSKPGDKTYSEILEKYNKNGQ